MSDFDEKSAEIEADNWWAKTHTSYSNREYVERAFIEGARWQHSLMQKRLAAMQNQIALYNRDSDDRHNEMAQLRAENAQLTATCGRYRRALEKIASYPIKGDTLGIVELAMIRSVARQALESGERGGRE